MELEEAITYRMAYGLAGDLAEGGEVNHPGRWRSNSAAGGRGCTQYFLVFVYGCRD